MGGKVEDVYACNHTRKQLDTGISGLQSILGAVKLIEQKQQAQLTTSSSSSTQQVLLTPVHIQLK
jgi:hypothetical protein